MNCLLCDSQNLTIKESHPIQDLKKLWDDIGVETDSELSLDSLDVYYCNHCQLTFFNPILAGGDEFYSALGKFDWYYLHPGKTEYDYVQHYIRDGDSILDIGAGRGVLFTKIDKRVEYLGLELSTKAVELAQEQSINVIKKDLLIHSQANPDKYDIVCLFQVLEHLTSLDAFIKSIHFTLKHNGLFLIAVPDNNGFVANCPNYTFNLPPHHTILWTEQSLRFLANKYNFEVVEVHRELLQDVHMNNAHKSYLIALAKRVLFLNRKLLDNSVSHRIISRIVNRLYNNKYFNSPLVKYLRKKQPNGQSIIISLRKK